MTSQLPQLSKNINSLLTVTLHLNELILESEVEIQIVKLFSR